MNNNTRTKNKRSSVLNKLRSVTIKNFKKNANHNKNEEEKKERRKKEHEEKLKIEKEEKILNIGYYLLAEIMYYDMSKSEQERLQKLGFTSYHRGIPKGKNIEFIKKLQGYKSYFTTNAFNRSNVPLKYKGYSRRKLETDYNLNDNSGIIILYNKEISKEYDGIIYLFNELKTKGELNEEAIELGTESYDSFPKDTLIMKKYQKENKEREMKEYNEKKKKNKEDEEKEKKRKNDEEEDRKKKDEARLDDETENKAEAHVKSAIEGLVKHLHTHVKIKRDMMPWSATEYNPRTSITGPYEGTYAVRQGLKKYKEEWKKYYNTLAY